MQQQKYYSTKHQSSDVSLREAILTGMPADNGLYMLEIIPPMPTQFFEEIHNLSTSDIAFRVAKNLIRGEIPDDDLRKIVDDAINFNASLVPLDDHLAVLELFHGPTLAFKDFGARFMARTMSYYVQGEQKKHYILVATSGDTGSAVANGFWKVPGIEVLILYPSGRVSRVQEQQLTTLGHNIIPLEVDGCFDDCQHLVKQAFLDDDLRSQMALTSANSINIARLIPQTFYYFLAYAQQTNKDLPLVFSVPSGNFGNLTAGLIARRMGLPVERFVVATNVNDVVPEYLKTGVFDPRASLSTLSNAMDVGNPSNFARMLDLYRGSVEEMRKELWGASFTDDYTLDGIKMVYDKYGYTIDPHGSVGYLGIEAFRKYYDKEFYGVVLETAHPAKFPKAIKEAIDQDIIMPERLSQACQKEKQSIPISCYYNDFKEFLLQLG